MERQFAEIEKALGLTTDEVKNQAMDQLLVNTAAQQNTRETPKAGKVKYVKSEEDFDDVKDSENPCGLKVSINKKTGKVSGSFKIYTAKTEKKLKTYTAKISGYVGNETLTVTVKKIGSVSASLE